MDGIKLAIIFLVIIVLLIRKVQLSIAMAAGICLLGVLYAMPPLTFFKAVWHGFVAPDTIKFILAILFIMFLERIFDEQGYRKRLLSSLSGLFHSRHLTIAAIPAFIGLIPSAGGAFFSAPMVQETCRGADVKGLDKAFCNYYYRHVWEVSLPTYPGVLVAIGLGGLTLPTFMWTMLPYSVLLILLGLPALKKVPNRMEIHNEKPRKLYYKDVFVGTLPILSMLVLILGLKMEVYLAILLIILVMLAYHRYRPKQWRSFASAIKWPLLLSVWLIMVFKEVLNASPAIGGLIPLISGLPIPEEIIFVLIAFCISLITGMMLPSLAITLPIAIAALGSPINTQLMAAITIASYSGNMFSPTHACMTISCDYFQISMVEILKKLAPYLLIPVFVSLAMLFLF